MRAHLLASFETRGIPDDALRRRRRGAADERQSRRARGRRARRARPRRGRRGEWAPLLHDAAERVATADVYVRWQPGVVAPTWMRTARGELLAVLAGVRARSAREAAAGVEARGIRARPAKRSAACASRTSPARRRRCRTAHRDATVLAFFYTRCMNPARCSLTITRLAGLRARTARPRRLAMTYDPGYDSPERMRRYGAERGFPFGERARLVRATDAWPEMRAMFGLRVGYGPVTVNEHAREFFLVGDDLSRSAVDPDLFEEPMTTG